MRYCQVGSNYKNPRTPIWVIGSSSHFTVLFSTRIQDCEQSESDRIFLQVKEAFKTLDKAEAGFIPCEDPSSIQRMLEILGVEHLVTDDIQLVQLQSRLEVRISLQKRVHVFPMPRGVFMSCCITHPIVYILIAFTIRHLEMGLFCGRISGRFSR